MDKTCVRRKSQLMRELEAIIREVENWPPGMRYAHVPECDCGEHQEATDDR